MDDGLPGDVKAIIEFIESSTPWRCEITPQDSGLLISLEHEFSPGLDVFVDPRRFSLKQEVVRHILANQETTDLASVPEGADRDLYLEMISWAKLLADRKGTYPAFLDLLLRHGVLRPQDQAWLELRQQGQTRMNPP